MTVNVTTPIIEDITSDEWMDNISSICNQINNHLKDDLKTLIIPDFTTTTDEDKLISSISLMNSMSNYFNYNFAYECGLSQLTLLGVLDDWIKLENKVIELKKFNQPLIDEWVNILIPVLDEFINTFSGNCNEDFWQKVCTSKSRGSGGEKKYGGWMFVFSPFDKEEEINKTGIYAFINDGCIASCNCSVKSKFIALDKEFEIHFLAGLVSTKYDITNNIINPNPGFLIVKKNNINLDFFANIKYKKLINENNKIIK